jgi:hypothetical protein
MINQQYKNRLFILGIFCLSIIPFFIAWGLINHSESLRGRTNNGKLINPIITTKSSDFSGLDPFSDRNLAELPGHWLLVNVMPNNRCNEICLESLLKTRQLRLMLNKDLSRTRRIVIVFKDLIDDSANQYWLKDMLLSKLRQSETPEDAALFSRLMHEENKLDDAMVKKLIGQENPEFALHSDLIRIKPSADLIRAIANLNKGQVPEGMLLLIDPLGNLMMQYEPGFDPYKVKSDLMQLLRVSQIG